MRELMNYKSENLIIPKNVSYENNIIIVLSVLEFLGQTWNGIISLSTSLVPVNSRFIVSER